MSQLNGSQIIQELSPFFSILCDMASSTTCIIWYTALTFDEEVKFIWPSKLSFVKVLYFVVRYLPLLLQIGIVFVFFGDVNRKGMNLLCSGIIWFFCIIGTLAIACSNILFIQRVYAFYGRSRPLLWFLSFCFILNEVAVVIIQAMAIPKYKIIPNSLPPPLPRLFGSCIFERHSGITAFVWFFELLFQTILFACVVARFAYLQYVAWKTGVPNSQLYKVFLRDGIWMFCILFFCFLFSGIYNVHSPTTVGLSLTLWSFVASSICSTRLILNLHHSANKRRDFGEASSWSTPQTMLRFHDSDASYSIP